MPFHDLRMNRLHQVVERTLDEVREEFILPLAEDLGVGPPTYGIDPRMEAGFAAMREYHELLLKRIRRLHGQRCTWH